MLCHGQKDTKIHMHSVRDKIEIVHLPVKEKENTITMNNKLGADGVTVYKDVKAGS